MKKQELYNIIIKEGEIYTGLTEDEFMDKILELSQCFYETGYPHPDLITHQTYGKDLHITDREQHPDDSQED